MIVAISGPSNTGKTKLVSLIKKELGTDVAFTPDFFDLALEELMNESTFKDFTEIYTDSTYVAIYASRVAKHLKSAIQRFKDYDGLVILDGSFIDNLIYLNLTLWFHYPMVEFLELMITDLLKLQDEFDLIYMTNPDDKKYIQRTSSIVKRRARFNNNRSLEFKFYDMYRRFPNVKSLPNASVEDSLEFVVEDIKKSYEEWKEKN